MFITNHIYRFFPSKEINGVDTFQDPGPLKNDPLISALLKMATTFLLVKEPDFIVSLGTGAPQTKGDKPSMSVSGPLTLWKDSALLRLWRMF
jgi:hypothetical protein